MFRSEKGFTLIELLVVIGVLAVLATVTALILNPAEYVARSRDAKRINDLDNLNRALNLYQVQGGSTVAANIIYISLPNTASDCVTSPSPVYTLPTLPSGWSYHCAPASSLTNNDGSGWLPIDFTGVAGLSLASLPVDPTNSDVNQRFYSYVGGSWDLSANPESTKYQLTASADGGNSVAYEVGSDLKLNPLRRTSFDFSSFPTTVGSNQPAWKKMAGTGTVTTNSDGQGSYLDANGFVWYEYQENIPFNPNSKYKISCKVRQITDPTSGGKGIYCGVAGVAADGVTYLNVSGANSSSSQHYFAASNDMLTAGAGYTAFAGYFKGTATAGVGGKNPNPNTPGKMYSGVAYFRPLFILNYSGGNGIADISFHITEVIE